MDDSADLMILAKSTPGSSGADLSNMLNEAALLAARKERVAVTMQEIYEARDKVLYGKERKNLELDLQEKTSTAYHESGHAILASLMEHADPIDKVTIIPRGFSLGATQFLPKKNRVTYWRKELLDQLTVSMGGRAAEEIFLQDVSNGAKQDIERATQLARSMVCEWGMSEALGTVTYDERSENGGYLGAIGYREKMYSDVTAQAIDQEVRHLLDEAYARAKKLISEHKQVIELMKDMLLEFETLDAEDIQSIVKGAWNVEEKRTKQIAILEKSKKVPPPPPKEALEGTPTSSPAPA
jgi:cell division protease FtsH